MVGVSELGMSLQWNYNIRAELGVTNLYKSTEWYSNGNLSDKICGAGGGVYKTHGLLEKNIYKEPIKINDAHI